MFHAENKLNFIAESTLTDSRLILMFMGPCIVIIF